MLGQDVLSDLNRTVTYSNLSPQIKADLNRTISKQMLGQDVLSDLNRKITKSMLSQEVLDDLNASIGPGKLSSQISSALKPVVLSQPTSVVAHSGMPTSLSVDATGGDNSTNGEKTA